MALLSVTFDNWFLLKLKKKKVLGFYVLANMIVYAYLCIAHSAVHNANQSLCSVPSFCQNRLNTHAMPMLWIFVVLTRGQSKSTKMTIWIETMNFSFCLSLSLSLTWRQTKLNKRKTLIQ